VNNIPILIGSNSVFSIKEIAATRQTYYSTKVRENAFKKRVRRGLPKLTQNRSKTEHDLRIRSVLNSLPAPIKGLQVGAGENPEGIVDRFPQIQWLHSDVDLSFKPHLIADVTSLPVADESLDVVYADQVLEHVIDIHKAANEIQRVLRVGGILVIGIPFMYPAHGVPYDFFRVTPCGIRALFAQTETIHIGRGSGAWSALALQMESRIVNLSSQRQIRMVASAVSRFLFSGLKYLDRNSNEKRNMVSCASVFYLGRKVPRSFSAHEIMSELRNRFAER
jgi:SAM-dependent methyltransferase